MASLIPENSAKFSLSEVAQLTGGTLHGSDSECIGVTTDSRSDLRGRLFVALRGQRFDGHEFVRRAAELGARGVVVEQPTLNLPIGAVQVKSTLGALGALGGAHRRRWGKRIVAVAGSAGKTTTRSTITAVLSAVSPAPLHFAAGNLNNLIGVPMVLFGLGAEHALGVVEVGTNAPGEVSSLSAMAAPDLAVLTLIGIEHSEGLGDLDGIEREEGEIWSGLSRNGVAVYNADDSRVARTVSRAKPAHTLSYGVAQGANYRLLSRTSTAVGGSRLEVERCTEHVRDSITLEIPLLGDAGAYAALAALAVAEWATNGALDPVTVSAALSGAGEPGRLTPIELADGTLLLDDSYNSNPASVTSSVSTACEIARTRAARLVLVIGEMRELGALSLAEHAAVGEMLSASGAAVLVAVMGDAALFLTAAKRAGLAATFAPDAEHALMDLLPRLRPRDVVLVKASRGVHAERLVKGLVEAKGRAALLHEFFYPFSREYSWAGALNVLRYTPFRAIMATITAMLMSFLVAPWFIQKLRGKQISQIIREEGPASHYAKRGTPTMGGALILLSVLVPTVLWADVRNVFVVATTAVTAGYGAVGFLDDRLKIEGSNTRGLPGRYKLMAQIIIGGFALSYVFLNTPALPHGWLDMRARLAIPFLAFAKHPVSLPLPLYLFFALFVVVAMSNAVNLTDGLDGLAIGPVMINAGAYLVWAYVAGSVLFGRPIAAYLDIAGIPEMSELAVFAAAMIGAGIGFLWYNTYPAQVFMGDVGSLALGGGLGMLAVLTKTELLSIVLGGVFVVEAASVVTQVVSFKLFGKRVFLMAPIHHHFEKKGWPEPRIIVRFWIISILLALVALSSLKLR